MNNQFIKNQRGVSLVEVVMAMGVFGLVSVGISLQFSLAAKAIARAKRFQESVSIDREINSLVMDRNHCLQSLQGLVVNANGDEKRTPVQALHYAIPDPDNPGTYTLSEAPLIAANTPHGDLLIKDIQFDVVHQLATSPRRFLVELSYMASDVGSTSVFGSTPARFVLQTDSNNAVTDCFSALDSSVALNERLCEIDGGGDWVYDPVSGRCKSRFVEQWYSGSNTSAQCPAGWSPASGSWSCSAYASGSWEDEYQTVSRDYEGGYTDEARPRPYVTGYNEGVCNCFYASDLPQTIKDMFVCQIHCRQDTESAQ